MRLRVIHVSRYAPDMPALWVDTSGAKPVLKAYVNGRYQTLSEEIPAGILTEDMIVNSLDSEAVDMPLSAAQGKILKSLLDEKQAALTPGTGIEITDDNTINVTLDTTVFKAVPSLPDSPASEDMNKIHLVPSENAEENNSYKEYLWVNNKWEEIGTYVSTVDLTPYLTKEDAGKTYQTITDSSLQTQDKTVPGAINEVNAGLEEVVKPYVINLTALLAAQDSESISAAVGGIDNLNGTVQNNQVIFGTLANGTVAVGIRVLGNQTTLTYFVDSVVGLTVNEIIITNTDGTLTKTANTHAVLTENMVINSLTSDETTLPLSAAQGKALDSKISGSVPYIIDDSKLSGEPTSEEIDTAIGGWDNLLAAIRNSRLIVTPYRSLSNAGSFLYFISAYYETSTYQSITLSTTVSTWNGKIEQRLVSLTILKGTNGLLSLKWGNTRVSELELKQDITDNNLATTNKTIVGAINEIRASIESGGSGSGDDSSYNQYLHKVYEEYGAVYNAETGYWELNGLTDLTEEDMWKIYLAGVPKTENLTEFYSGESIRTTFNFPIRGRGTGTGAILRGTFLNCMTVEVVQFYENPLTPIYADNLSYAFSNCRKLREIVNILHVSLPKALDNIFHNCKALKSVKLQSLRKDIAFSASPLLSYESLNYLVTNAANTSAITVTVHPTTYSYLTGTAQPTEEVGGTTEEWQALVTTAQGKQISFA